ncbi:uncharacterized protein [Lepeophtheirus salmonis]|uniref:uncharacterized protein isoform X6 n=1 Tax=Lepeophtheirus salmonis TaxID=72036 RepID=UPI001AE8DEE8|nr:delta-like protein C isoform X3 [Lepeophtheirus salmonis]
MKFHCFTILTFVSINYTFSHIQLNDSVELSDKCLVKIFQEHHAYICDSRRNQNCFNGRYDDDKHCMNPSVAFFKNKDCYNENCLMPNSSFCNSGWKGIACSLCIPLPGCQHGICKKPYECICKKGYQGVLCNKPQCDNCKHVVILDGKETIVTSVSSFQIVKMEHVFIPLNVIVMKGLRDCFVTYQK